MSAWFDFVFGGFEVYFGSRHVGKFGELGRARQTTQQFAEPPLIAFNFIVFDVFGFVTFGEKPMDRTKVAGRDMPPCKRAKGIKIIEDDNASKAKATKLSITGGKRHGKGKAPTPASSEVSSDSDRIYATHLTTSKSEGEHQDNQAAISKPEDELLSA
uniref:Integrase core domain containing protein n=1 Tax=Solanum tuberosum TaxID=4113 RepID=M1DFJ7_SOLTU